MASHHITDTRLEQPVDPSTSHVELFGLPFTPAGCEREIADQLLARSPERGRPALMVTPNVDILVQLEHPSLVEMRSVFESADWVLADGWPIVAVSRLAGRPLPGRTAGSSVFAEWWPAVAAAATPVVALVSSEAVAAGLAAEHPEALFVVAPRLNGDLNAVRATAKELVGLAVDTDAAFIVSAIGFPKDGFVAQALLDQWPHDRPGPAVLCVGASAEMHLGLRRRAPRWIQQWGLEWLYRFGQEPRRLFGRYFVRSTRFLPLALREVTGGGRR